MAQSQKYGSRMASRHYDSTGNFAWIRKRQGRHVYLIHFQLEFLNIIVNLIFLSCLSYMSLSMPTLSSRMKFTFKKGFCHSHMETFQRSSHTLLWNCWRERGLHTSSYKGWFLKIKIRKASDSDEQCAGLLQEVHQLWIITFKRCNCKRVTYNCACLV